MKLTYFHNYTYSILDYTLYKESILSFVQVFRNTTCRLFTVKFQVVEISEC